MNLKYLLHGFLVLVILAVVRFFPGAAVQEQFPWQEKDMSDSISFGYNSHAGNMLGVQLELTPDMYTGENFGHVVEQVLCAAQAKGFLQKDTIVAFPAHTGTYLYLAGEHKDGTEEKKIRNNSKNSAAIYQRTFAKMAKRFGIIIAAGSIVLPSPVVRDGLLTPGSGKLQNAAYIFSPEGEIVSGTVEGSFDGQTGGFAETKAGYRKFGVVFTGDFNNGDLRKKLIEAKIFNFIFLGKSTLPEMKNFYNYGYHGIVLSARGNAGGKSHDGESWLMIRYKGVWNYRGEKSGFLHAWF